MKKLSKLLSMLLITITLSSCFLVGCNIKKEKKYDVTIKIGCTTGESWIFTPDVEELYWELEYDGIERTIFIDKYNLAKHPRWGDKWFDPSPYGANVFLISLLYGDGEKWLYEKKDRIVLEKGTYCYTIMADKTSNLWYCRFTKLTIKVI